MRAVRQLSEKFTSDADMRMLAPVSMVYKGYTAGDGCRVNQTIAYMFKSRGDAPCGSDACTPNWLYTSAVTRYNKIVCLGVAR